MVIHDLNVKFIAGTPAKADPPLLVYADTMLALAIPLQPLKSIPRWNPEVIDDRGCVEHPEFSKCRSLDPRTEFLDGMSSE